ncbi:MAG: hypothetical protein AB8B73_13590 [Ekhidna sp.]
MKALVSSFLLIGMLSGYTQNKLADRVYFGGGFGLSANANQTNVSLSPQVGYKITERYSAGIGIIYQYVGLKQFDVSLNNYGGSVFNRFNLTQQFFAYAEFERLNYEYFAGNDPRITERAGYSSFLIGGGFSEQISRSASFNVTALYNVLYDVTDSPQPYNSPLVIRAGIGLGIF